MTETAETEVPSLTGEPPELDTLEIEVDGQIGTLTLNRPDSLNAMSPDLIGELTIAAAWLADRAPLRALIVTGAGRAFCSGGDVDEIIGATLAMRPDELLAFTRMTGDVVKAMRECPVPIVAAVHGTAAGAGSVLALAADFRVVARSAQFAFLFTKVGLAGADMGAAYLLPRLVGLGRATELLMLGDALPAEDANRYGLVSELVEDDSLDEAAQSLARRLADGPTQAYALTKALLSRELDMGLSGALELEAMTQALLMNGADYREFYAAFTEKRPPEWQGR